MEIGNNSLIVPSALQAQVEEAAAEDQRPASDLLRDAVERYLRDRRWQRTLAYGEERARVLGLTEEDVPRLIAEVRRERRQEQQGV
jgi:metal-responsive CopG/Arc/MetJ family transcriptional regulator